MIVTKLALPQPKKNSIRYNATDPNPGVSSLYVSRAHLPQATPAALISVVLTPEEWERIRETLTDASAGVAS